MALQVKRCLEETRKSSTTILEQGQPLYATDKHMLYIGDGTTEAKDLAGTPIGLNIENGANVVDPETSEVVTLANIRTSHRTNTPEFENITTYSDWHAGDLGIAGNASSGFGRYLRTSTAQTFVAGYSNQEYATVPSGVDFTKVAALNSPKGELVQDLTYNQRTSSKNNSIFGSSNRMYASSNSTQIGAANITVGASNTFSAGYFNKALYTNSSGITIGFGNTVAGTPTKSIIKPLAIGNSNSVTHDGSILIGQNLISNDINQVRIGYYDPSTKTDKSLTVSSNGKISGYGFTLGSSVTENGGSKFIDVGVSGTLDSDKIYSNDFYLGHGDGQHLTANSSMFKITYNYEPYFYIAHDNDVASQCFFKPKVYFQNGLSSSKAPDKDNDVVRKVDLASIKASISTLEPKVGELSDVVGNIEGDYAQASYLHGNYYDKAYIDENTAKPDVYTRLGDVEARLSFQAERLGTLETDLGVESSRIDGTSIRLTDAETNINLLLSRQHIRMWLDGTTLNIQADPSYPEE